MDTPEARARLEGIFPGLASARYHIRSEATPDYNCIAFAAGVTDVNWDPSRDPFHDWPDTGDEDQSIENLVAAYRTLGFSRCQDGSLQANVEKIAIYGGRRGDYTHAAVQRESGAWASKIGELHDIEHEQLESLYMSDYGEVKCFVARPRHADQ